MLTDFLMFCCGLVKAEKEKEENRHNEEIESLNDRQLQEIQELEHQHNQKLMNEYEKYQGLQKRSQEMQSDYEIQLEQMAASKESALKDLAEYWEVIRLLSTFEFLSC